MPAWSVGLLLSILCDDMPCHGDSFADCNIGQYLKLSKVFLYSCINNICQSCRGSSGLAIFAMLDEEERLGEAVTECWACHGLSATQAVVLTIVKGLTAASNDDM